jgi:hypothetical protein
MKVAEIAILIFVFTCGALAIYWSLKAQERGFKPSHCAFAEISPDFNYQDREKCRLIRGHKL